MDKKNQRTKTRKFYGSHLVHGCIVASSSIFIGEI